MKFVYNLLEVDKKTFGDAIYPRNVVEKAIKEAEDHRARHGLFKGVLELCVISKALLDTRSTPTLEVIGWIDRLWIENGFLMCSAVIDDLEVAPADPVVLSEMTAVPYVDIRQGYTQCAGVVAPHPAIRRVTDLAITEVVLVDQAVTKLALCKYQERKSNLAVDRWC